MDSPVALPKSIKNPTEIDGMKYAYVSNMTGNASCEMHLYMIGIVSKKQQPFALMKSCQFDILTTVLSSQPLVPKLN